MVLADDTSGFLEATKLSAAIMVDGQDEDADRIVAAFETSLPDPTRPGSSPLDVQGRAFTC